MNRYQLYLGDCLDAMKKLPENYVDLTVTSPPYDDLRIYKGYSFDFENVAKELYRITKDGGVVVWIVNDSTVNGSETGTSFRQALYFQDVCGFNRHDTMFYIKKGCPFPDRNRYYSAVEYMFILSKGVPKTVNLIRDRVNRTVGEKKARLRAERQSDGSLRPNSAAKIDPDRRIKEYGVRYNYWIYDIGGGKSSKDSIAFNHPATFPERLAQDHIISWSNKGDLVFDPFMGSGTVGKMALLLQRRFIGCEIAKEYFELAKARIERADKGQSASESDLETLEELESRLDRWFL